MTYILGTDVIGQLRATASGTELRFFVADGLGSTRLLTGPAGGIDARYAYDSAGNALGFATRGRAVGSEQIHAALGAYLLAGFAFGLLYWVLNHLTPGALTVGGIPAPANLAPGTTIYFSFVTLASLGYGDVLPASEIAQGVAVMEVVGGQLYLAVLVARLVGLHRG